MKMKNLLFWLLPFFILAITQCYYETTESNYEADNQRGVVTTLKEEKIYDTATIKDKDSFDGSTILVVLDQKTGGINKPHKKSFFGSFEIEDIEDLTEIIGDIDSKLYLNKEQFHQILKIKLPQNNKENVLNVRTKLEKVEGILYAGPNYYFKPATGSNDPRFVSNEQWGLNGTNGIKAPAAWDITTGARSILVGIIDTGIVNHEDLRANVLPGWNFEDDNSNTSNTYDGHGTQVAGIVGAVGNNSTGIAGVAWDVSLIPFIVGNNERTKSDNVADAITSAINGNIGILNFSLYSELPGVQVYKTALQNYSGLFVCAAANEDINLNDGNIHYLGFYNTLSQLDNVIIVGAIDSNGNRWSGSNYGKNTVHLFAPGDNIVSTHLNHGYYVDSGTSFAAPHVTGAAVLLKSVHPNLTAAQIKTILINNVDKNSKLTSFCTSGGQLNVQKALISQGTVVGFMDINFNYSGVSGTIGRFYLFTSGKWAFVERGFEKSPTSPTWFPITNANPFANTLRASLPDSIKNSLGSRTINTQVQVLIPATDPRFGRHYAGVTVNVVITKTGVTISGGNTIVPVGADMHYCQIFKIANKQGNL
jgi:subtilisin family serine protease